MFSEDKVTEIFCLADEFCKFFDAQQEKSMLEVPQDGKRHRRKPNRMSDTHIFSFRWFPLFQALLSALYLQTLQAFISQNSIIQPLCGTGKRSVATADRINQTGSAWRVHGNKFCRQHATSCMPQSAHTYAQDI